MGADRPLPRATPETREFWDGVGRHQLLLQRCDDCRLPYFPPQPTCPRCAGATMTSFAASGVGRVYSAITSHLAPPGFSPPYVLAVIELDEGPRLLSLIRGIDPDEDVALDTPVEVVFEEVGDTTLYAFRPQGPP